MPGACRRISAPKNAIQNPASTRGRGKWHRASTVTSIGLIPGFHDDSAGDIVWPDYHVETVNVLFGSFQPPRSKTVVGLS